MIMGEQYWEVYTDNEFKNETAEYYGGIRIEGESTLFLPRNEGLPFELMNTGKRVGERFKKYNGEEEYEVELIEITTININGEQRKRYVMETPYCEETWIEGIGGENYFLGSTNFCGFEYSELMCYKRRGEELYGECMLSSAGNEGEEQEGIEIEAINNVLRITTKREIEIVIYTIEGKELRKEKQETGTMEYELQYRGIILVEVKGEKGRKTKKLYIT